MPCDKISQVTAPYKLNRDKQLQGILKDSNITDYEVEISSIAHNVNIKCSTGFYSQVVLPLFTEMSSDAFIVIIDEISISCSSVTGRTDASESNVNAMLVFPLSNDECNTIGSVTVHLHHTSRKAQMQGSSIVDSLRAPVWLLERYLREKLNQMAVSKRQIIDSLNSTVSTTLKGPNSSNQNMCKACNRLISKRFPPANCKKCNNVFHKKCFHGIFHKQSCSEQSVESSPSVSSLPTIANCQNDDTQVPVSHSQSLLSITNQARASELFTLPIGPTSVDPSRNSQPLESLSNTNNNANTDPQPPPSRKEKRQSQQTPVVDPQKFELESKTAQINTAHAKIADLESELSELKDTNKILN